MTPINIENYLINRGQFSFDFPLQRIIIFTA